METSLPFLVQIIQMRKFEIDIHTGQSLQIHLMITFRRKKDYNQYRL